LKELYAIGVNVAIEGKDFSRGDNIGEDIIRLVPWGQGFRDMAGAVDGFESSVLDRRFKHDDNPVLTWCVSNAHVISDPAGNRKLDKSKSRFRIDGAVAVAMALGLKNRDMSEAPPEYAYSGLTEDEIMARMAL
jgi:phage terminase large subunit-like protein